MTAHPDPAPIETIRLPDPDVCGGGDGGCGRTIAGGTRHAVTDARLIGKVHYHPECCPLCAAYRDSGAW